MEANYAVFGLPPLTSLSVCGHEKQQDCKGTGHGCLHRRCPVPRARVLLSSLEVVAWAVWLARR